VSAPAARPRGRTRYVVAALACGGAVIAATVLMFALSGNVQYFRTVSEAVTSQDDGRFKLMGAVVPGSRRRTDDVVTFELTDGKKTVTVRHSGDTPALFEDGAPVVCEGRWGRDEAFASDRIMIKHGEEYTPPKVDAGGQGG